MFETSVVHARAKTAARRPLLLSFSIAAHAAAIIGVIATSVATVTLPKNAPNQISIPFFKVPVVLPPRLGTPEAKKPAAATPPQAVKRTVAPPSTVVAPNTIPDKVATVTTTQATTTDVGLVTNNNGSGGPGPGDPNGTRDGLNDGGILTDVKPPEPVIVRLAKQPVVLHRVLPQYPPLMQKIRLNGFVILDCIIDQTGHIRDAHVVSSSNPGFEQSALDAVYQWQFQPGTMNGAPVNAEFELKVTFQIH